MKLILAEKPSVGMDIAKSLGGFQKHDGYLESSEYFITWAYGHLVEIDDSSVPKEWSLENLPIYPERFEYRPGKDKSKQLNTIKKILNKSDGAIIATDAAREGELIARLILIHCGWKKWKETYRFWTSEALTPTVVKKYINNVQPASKYDKYFFSGLSRQHADWIVGINLTRYVSVRASGKWTVGRVQTPTMYLINKRWQENVNFKPEEFYSIKAIFEKGEEFSGSLVLDENKKLNKSEAGEIARKVKENPTGAVVDLVKKDKTTSPPLLHSLNTLQQEANEKYGFTAKQTLDIAQALYEKHKSTSYPRTESNHLGDSNQPLAKGILEKLTIEPTHLEIGKNNIPKVGKRVFNDEKLTDHHAIIPLKEADGLNEKEQKVFDLVKRRFVAAFLDAYEYEDTEIIIIATEHFKVKGKKTTNKGWREVIASDSNDQLLPELSVGESVTLKDCLSEQKFTSAPSLYTDSSLIKLMEKHGLGTSATRAGIIEKIISTGYVERKKKSILGTQKALELIKNMDGSKILLPDLTGEWESRLETISNKSVYREFLDDAKQFVEILLEDLKDKEFTSVVSEKKKKFVLELAKQKKQKVDLDKINDNTYLTEFIENTKDLEVSLGNCSCGGNILENKKAYSCINCKALVWKVTLGKKLTEKQAIELMKGKTVKVKGLKGKKGKFDAGLKLEDPKKGKITLVFDKK